MYSWPQLTPEHRTRLVLCVCVVNVKVIPYTAAQIFLHYPCTYYSSSDYSFCSSVQDVSQVTRKCFLFIIHLSCSCLLDLQLTSAPLETCHSSTIYLTGLSSSMHVFFHPFDCHHHLGIICIVYLAICLLPTHLLGKKNNKIIQGSIIV